MAYEFVILWLRGVGSSLLSLLGGANRLIRKGVQALLIRDADKVPLWLKLDENGKILLWAVERPAYDYVDSAYEDKSPWVYRRLTPSHLAHIIGKHDMAPLNRAIKDCPATPSQEWSSFCNDPVEEWTHEISVDFNKDRIVSTDKNEPRHVCGMQGYDGMLGDTCPACDKQNRTL